MRSIFLAAVALTFSVGVAQAACDPAQGLMELSTSSAAKVMSLPADKQAAVSKAMQDATNAMATGKNEDACKAIEEAKALLK